MPTFETHTDTSLHYQSGFANDFATEALPGALPLGRNSPQRAPYGLYAEQLSGTAFTAPRAHNRRSWLYRIRPAAVHQPFTQMRGASLRAKLVANFAEVPPTPPNQLRWDPLPMPAEPTDFIDGWVTMAGNGAAESMNGCAIHLYAANRSMKDRFFYSADGELLIVPQEGRLSIATELGKLDVEPFEIAVIPRGVRFAVTLPDGAARGYICENFGALLRLPDLGPIGSNGLANPRDFLTPHAAYEDREGAFELVAKMNGTLWRADIGHSPLDVVAWHGNYAPYKYDLRRFNTIGSISFDHPDPSIFLVLQSRQRHAGRRHDRLRDFPAALACRRRYVPAALVPSQRRERIHGPRARRRTTRRPKASCRAARACTTACRGMGRMRTTFEKASHSDTSKPAKVGDTMAFMFETRTLIKPTRFALETAQLQAHYYECWQGLNETFQPGATMSTSARICKRRSIRARKAGSSRPTTRRATSRSRTCRSAFSATTPIRRGAWAWRSATGSSTWRCCNRPGCSTTAEPCVRTAPALNDFIALGRDAWRSVRIQLSAAAGKRHCDPARRRRAAPARAGAAGGRDACICRSRFPATRISIRRRSTRRTSARMFRDPKNALLPNWSEMPIGYNGRASSVVVSGTPVRRPNGQIKLPDQERPVFGACRKLDIELETGFIVGAGNALGEPIACDDAEQHIFGMVLLNDWSARDIQQWEYVPLGPFNAKSFATTISPWIVTLDALEPFRTAHAAAGTAAARVPAPRQAITRSISNWK